MNSIYLRRFLVAFVASLLVIVVAGNAWSDQRFETVGGFCHFVTPEGFQNGNDDNEVFFSNCENSIRQKSDGTGEGSTRVTVFYPMGSQPFVKTHTASGADTGIDCVMVDSNGTTYTTRQWRSRYKVMGDSGKIEYTVSCRNADQQ